MTNLDSELDAIFDKIVTITEAPKLPKNRRVKTTSETGTNIEVNTKIYLSVPTDHQYLYEVSDIQDKENRSSIVVQGLSEALEVGSWIRKSELSILEKQNKNIRFIIGGRENGK